MLPALDRPKGIRRHSKRCSTLSLALLAGLTVHAQENPPPAPPESPTFIPRTPYYPSFYSEEPRDYNLRWGKLTGRLRGSMQIEYNDNINLSDADARADLILGPFVGMGFLWPLSEKNILQFDLGVGYRAYLDNSALNSLLISPDSRLNYQIRVLDAQITIHDQFAIEVDPLSRPEISGTTAEVLDYHRFNNDAGFTVNWEPLRGVTILGGYNYVIDRSLNNDFLELDRDDHIFHIAGYRGFGSHINLGLRSSYTITEYVEPIQNNGETFAVGPHLIAQLTEFVTADAGVNYTRADYRSTGTLADASDFNGITFFAGAQHRVNSRTSHYLRLDRTINPGFGSNFTDMIALQYGISLRASSAISLKGTFVFEDLTSSGTLSENSNRYLWYLGSNFRISRTWTAGLAYSFGVKKSDFAGRDYTQNRITLDITRHF
jgi:hypothetical protein